VPVPVQPDLIPTNVVSVEKIEPIAKVEPVEQIKQQPEPEPEPEPEPVQQFKVKEEPTADEIYMNQQSLLEQQEQLVEQLMKNEDPEEPIEQEFILSPDQPGIVALALYDYQAGADDEISFDPNDVISHIEMVSFFVGLIVKITILFVFGRLTRVGGEVSIKRPTLMAYSPPITCKSPNNCQFQKYLRNARLKIGNFNLR
jgi:hypothetical protein